MTIYYRDSIDGQLGAAIAVQWHKENKKEYTLVECHNSESIPGDLQEGYVFDLVYKPKSPQVYVFHHEHDEEDGGVRGRQSLSTSELSWFHFYPKRQIPTIVKIIKNNIMGTPTPGDRDVYNAIELLYIKSPGNKNAVWYSVLDEDFNSLLQVKETSLLCRATRNALMAKALRFAGFPGKFGRLKVFIVNTIPLVSLVSFLEKYKEYDGILAYTRSGNGYSYHLYTKKGLGRMLKKYNILDLGGGEYVFTFDKEVWE